MKLFSAGYGNYLVAERVIAIVSPDSAPMRRLKTVAREAAKLLDATEGRRTRCIVITDSDHVILCAIAPDTLAERLRQEGSWDQTSEGGKDTSNGKS